MNSLADPHAASVGNRRRFLKTFAMVGGAVALAPVAAVASDRRRYPCWLAKSFCFAARGKGRFADVVGYYWPFPPKEQMAFASFEMAMQFPYQERDLLRLQVWLLPPASMAYDPTGNPVLISQSLAHIEEITVGPPVEYPVFPGEPPLGAKPTFGLMGRVIENDIESPFGPMVGKTALFGAAFDREGKDVNFYLLGGMVAGQHATYLRPFQERPGEPACPVEHAKGYIYFHGY